MSQPSGLQPAKQTLVEEVDRLRGLDNAPKKRKVIIKESKIDSDDAKPISSIFHKAICSSISCSSQEMKHFERKKKSVDAGL